MKLGIICTLMRRFGKKGFYNSQEIGLGKALSEMGHEVVFYRGMPKDTVREEIKINDHFTAKYIPIRKFGAHGYLNTKELDENLDAVLVFSDNQIFLPHIHKFCKKHNISMVLYTGIPHSMFPGTMQGFVMDTLFNLGSRQVYRKCPVIAKTENARQELIKLGCKDVSISPVGLDTTVMKKDFDKIDRTEIRKEFGIHDDEIVIVNVARMEPDKRPLDFVRLISSLDPLKPYHAVMIGDGWQRKDVEAQIYGLGLGNKFTVIPKIPYENMWKVYKIADYYINVSREEIFGMAVMEAIYYKIPTAASEAMGPSTILKDMPAHKLCKTDDQILSYIEKEPVPDEQELEKAREKLIRDFSWKNTAEAFVRAVEK